MAADGRADWREQIVERDARGSGKRAPRKRRATSIQSIVQSDSIIALSQRRRRVLQHNPARNGKSRWITPAALTVRTCPRDSDVESPSLCYALTTRGCLSQERYQSTPAASNNAGTSPTR